MEFIHPIQRHAANVPGLWETAARQAAEWDAIVQQMEALQPGDLTAEDVLRSAASLLQTITVNYGPIAGWTVAQHRLIFQHAERLFGAGQLKFNKPAVSLSGNGPGASLFHGMRMKYRHSGGL